MTDLEPVESKGNGVSIWVVVAVVVAAMALLGVPLWFLINNALGSETTTTVPEAVVTTTTSPETTTSAAEPTSTTTTEPVTTTTVLQPEDENPFVGWWKATDVDESHMDLRIDAEGGFFHWDSASGLCMNDDVRSPETWVGTTSLQTTDRPTLTASGTANCYFYGADNPSGRDRIFDFYYHPDTDMLEFAPDGVRYARSPSVPGIPPDDNPFVGSWEGTDSDGTHVEMMILGDGSWQSTDTRSGGCERKGFTYATWSGEGSGTFDMSGTPSFDVFLTTYCHPVGEEKLVHTPEVNFVLSYEQSSDTLMLDGAGTSYTRLP